MSVHNGAPWVRDAVASVLAQTAGDLELIVIDDGSTDTTREILARARDPRVRVEHQTRAGLTRALNHALALARAPLAARLDADDLALPERLERQLAFLARSEEHTSELQSRLHLVCRLLLEKKKKNKKNRRQPITRV